MQSDNEIIKFIKFFKHWNII